MGPRRSLLLLRLAAVVHALVAAGQPHLAGLYMTGSSGSMRSHELLGSALAVLALLQLAAAIGYWRPGGGRRWPIVACALLFVAEVLQIGMGYSRVLAIHVPLGVSIVATSIMFAIWTLRPAARAIAAPA